LISKFPPTHKSDHHHHWLHNKTLWQRSASRYDRSCTFIQRFNLKLSLVIATNHHKMSFIRKLLRSPSPSPPPPLLTFRQRWIQAITGEDYHEWEERHRVEARNTINAHQARHNSYHREALAQAQADTSEDPDAIELVELPAQARSLNGGVGRAFGNLGVGSSESPVKEEKESKSRRTKKKKERKRADLCCVLKLLCC